MTTEKTKFSHIKSVTAITEVFAEGQKVTAAILEFDKEIDNSKLNLSTFLVDGRTITKVYANNVAAKAKQGVDGRYVIIELSVYDENASTLFEIKKENKVEIHRKDIKIYIKQLEDIITTDGEKYKPNQSLISNDLEINMVVDDFIKNEFYDLKSGEKLKYNLFIPKGYDKNKLYPLVIFIHDRGACSNEYNLGLIQGLGGVIWANKSEQKKHECFILVPQYANAIVNDDFETTKHFDITIDLINSIVNQYSIDRNRLYATGQSMGCMALIEMGIRYPNMFAAMLLCAGQWDPRRISILAKNKIWILVSEGDTRAFNGMNACMASLELAGAKISRLKWDGRIRGDETELYVKQAIEEGSDIKYTVYKNGTLVLDGEDNMFNNHAYTWRLVYTIEGLRDWLFAQVRS